jgi:hypothetical protein
METDENAVQCWHTVMPTGRLLLDVEQTTRSVSSNLIMRVADDLLVDERRPR